MLGDLSMSAYYLKQTVKEWNLALIYRGMADFRTVALAAPEVTR